MGQGGNVNLINRTSRKWVKASGPHSYQMRRWGFPDSVWPNSESPSYIEWGDALFSNRADDGGEFRYRIEGVRGEFELQARGNTANGPTIIAKNYGIPPAEWGYETDEVRLGWKHNGTVEFTLPGSDAWKSLPHSETWMSRLTDRVKLSQLNIPGTHDSGTSKIADFGPPLMYPDPVGVYARCQDLTLDEQLKLGVRFLDIRCRRVDGDKFTIHHDDVYAQMNFDEVLEQCSWFLDRRPKETIIMSIMEEVAPDKKDGDRFDHCLNDYVRRYKRLNTVNTIQELGKVRGYITLMNRFSGSSNKGIQWNRNDRLMIQDEFNPSGPVAKMDFVAQHLDDAMTGDPDRWYINFASAYKWNIPPRPYAALINPSLRDAVSRRADKNVRFGTVLQDFCTEDVVRNVIRSNERWRA